MKLTCDVISDLMPLYIDGGCTADSRAMVEEHIEECENCKRKLEMMQKLFPVLIQECLEEETYSQDDRNAKQAFKKLRKHWWRIVSIAVATCILLALGSHELSGGVAISNISGILSSQKVVTALINKEYEKAFFYLDTNEHLHILKNLTVKEQDTPDTTKWAPVDWAYATYKDYTEGSFRQEMQTNFISNMEKLNKKGIYIKSANFKAVNGSILKGWEVAYLVEVYDDNSRQTSTVTLNFSYKSNVLTLANVMTENVNDNAFDEVHNALLSLYSFDNAKN